MPGGEGMPQIVPSEILNPGPLQCSQKPAVSEQYPLLIDGDAVERQHVQRSDQFAYRVAAGAANANAKGRTWSVACGV